MSIRARTAWGKHIGGPAALFDALVSDPRKLIPALELCAAFRADLTLATLPGGSFARERKSWSHLSVLSMPFRFHGADAKQSCWDRDASAALKCTLLALFGSDVLHKGGHGLSPNYTPYQIAVTVGQLTTAAAILLLTEAETWPTLADHKSAVAARPITLSKPKRLNALTEALQQRTRAPLTRLFLDPGVAASISATAANVLRAADETRGWLADPMKPLLATREAVAVVFMAMDRFWAQRGVGLPRDIMLMLILPQAFTSAGGQAAALAAKLGVQAQDGRWVKKYFKMRAMPGGSGKAAAASK